MTNKKQRPVPVKVGDIVTMLDLRQVRSGDWTIAHGTTASGVEVHSPRFAVIGDSTIFQADNGAAFSLDNPDAEVLARRYLEHLGYTVSTPAKS